MHCDPCGVSRFQREWLHHVKSNLINQDVDVYVDTCFNIIDKFTCVITLIHRYYSQKSNKLRRNRVRVLRLNISMFKIQKKYLDKKLGLENFFLKNKKIH